MAADVRIGNVLDEIADVFTSLPGGGWVAGAIESGTGWIGDMAKTSGGQIALIAISNALLFPAVANIPIPSVSGQQFVGPQIASVVWAIPGVAAGDPFIETYAHEVTTRGLEILAYFGGEAAGQAAKQEVSKFTSGISKAINDAGLRDALAKFKATFGQRAEDEIRQRLKDQGLDPESVAKRYWVRYDSAAEATQGLFGRRVYDIDGEFPLDGSPPRYLTAAYRNKLKPLQQHVGPSNRLPVDSYDVRPRNAAAFAALKNINVVFASEDFSFDTRVNSGSRGPVGQILLLALLTSPAWAPVLLPSILKIWRH